MKTRLEETGSLITSDLMYPEGEAPWRGLAVTTLEELEDHLWHCSAHERLVLDFETRQGTVEEGVNPYTAEIIGVAIGTEQRMRYLPVRAYRTDPVLPWGEVRAFLEELGHQDHLWSAHYGVGFDWILWKREGLPWPLRINDTLVMALVGYPHRPKGQKDLEAELLGVVRPNYKDTVGSQKDLTRVALEVVADYAVRDGQGVCALEPVLRADLQAKGLVHHYEASRDQIHVKMWMEERGMAVDRAFLEEQNAQCETFILAELRRAEVMAQAMTRDPDIRLFWGEPDKSDEALQEAGLSRAEVARFWEKAPPIHQHASALERHRSSINVRSRKQMMDFLFRRCGLKSDYGSGIKEGVNSSVLIRMRRDGVEIADPLLGINKAGKMVSGFYSPLIANMTLDADGAHRIRCLSNPWRAVTARWTSSDPVSLQTQSNYNEAFPWTGIRRGFIASPGHKLIVGDLSQIELRILAELAQDPEMLRIFADDGDIHALTGSRLAGVPYAEFLAWETSADPEQRQLYKRRRKEAKAPNFGISYLMGAEKFQVYAADAFDVWWSVKESQRVIDAWFNLFKGVRNYHQDILRQLVGRGYVTTMTGRRAYFDQDLASIVYTGARQDPAYKTGHRAWRQAVNYCVQGSAADLIMAAQKAAFERYFGSEVWHLNQVHDELIFEAPDAQAERVAAEVKEILEARQDILPYKSSVKCGTDWMSAHD